MAKYFVRAQTTNKLDLLDEFDSRGEALDRVFYLASNHGEKNVSLLKNGVALFWIYAKAGR
jgi:hypothetical protein